MVLACYVLDVAWWLVPLMLYWLHPGYLKPSVESGLRQPYSSSADEVWIHRNTCPEQGVVPVADRHLEFGIVRAMCPGSRVGQSVKGETCVQDRICV